MNVIFLDYDGVVNTPMWDADGKRCRYNTDLDGKVNNFQAAQWISEFCEKYNYKIVVTSTWRLWDHYDDCLYAGGLRKDVEIIGATPIIPNASRGEEINAWRREHPDVERFLIVDDENDMGDLSKWLVQCRTSVGFGMTEYYEAVRLNKLWEDK